MSPFALFALIVGVGGPLALGLAVLVDALSRHQLHMAPPQRRAWRLLERMLDPAEMAEWKTRRYVTVHSPSMTERSYRLTGGLTQVYDHDIHIMDLCLRPEEALPLADRLLLQKLLIEGDEERYILAANCIAPGVFGPRAFLDY